jgi:glycosyltransferase involved in cell wall biosynthesis
MGPSRLPSGSGGPGRICLVTAELAYLHKNGGIGTANWHLAHTLAQAGLGVHILYAGQVPDADTLHQARQRLDQAGIGLTLLHLRRRPGWLERFTHDNWQVNQSEWIAHVLGQLHQEQRFDLIEFPELAAMGFRPMQARRAGLAFTGTTMLIKLHSSNQWCREANQRWMHSGAELLIDYCERYCFEQADVQFAPCRYMLDYAAGIGWPVREQAQVVPYVYPQPIGTAQPSAAAPEVVFFGRLETRKGLELFLRSARQLDPLTPITFLGSLLPLTGGGNAVEMVRQELGNRPFRLHTDLNQDQAIRYLLSRPCLAVIPSLTDNYPNTLIECISNRIPFVATRVGGTPEIVTDPELNRRLLCDPTPDDLLHAIRGYLDASLQDRLEIHDRLSRMVDVEAHNRKVAEAYIQVLRQHREQGNTSVTVGTAVPGPLVTVAVAGTSAEGLAETLESLRTQTHARLEVLVLDGPAQAQVSPAQRNAWQERDGRLRWVAQDQMALAGQWQEALPEARGEFFLPLVAGTVAHARLIEKLVRGLQANDLLAGLTCPVLGYHDAGQRAREEWCNADRPIGGGRLLACLENVFGEGPTLYRTEVLRRSGGFDQDAPAGPQTWALGVQLLDQGYPLDVAPELLAQVCVPRDPSRRMTEAYQMHRYLVQRYVSRWTLSPLETASLWSALSGMHQTLVILDKHKGRLEKLRRAALRVLNRLENLVPEPGRRWVVRTLRNLWHWGQKVIGRGEPWRHPTPVIEQPVMQRLQPPAMDVEPRHEDVAA